MASPTHADADRPASALAAYRRLPGSIWALGLVSMFMDMSSELVHSLLPLFMVAVLGASMTTIGMLEGIAEATAAVTKVFSGALSDHFRKRKGLVVLGYALAAVWGLHMALTQGLLAKLVADAAPHDLRGTAFGFFNLATGVALLLASLIAGSLWDAFGAEATFAAGAGFAVLAAAGVLFYRPAARATQPQKESRP